MSRKRVKEKLKGYSRSQLIALLLVILTMLVPDLKSKKGRRTLAITKNMLGASTKSKKRKSKSKKKKSRKGKRVTFTTKTGKKVSFTVKS